MSAEEMALNSIDPLVDHTVAFYDSPNWFFTESLVHWSIPSFMNADTSRTEVVVVLARQEYIDMFLQRLKIIPGLHVDKLIQSNRLIVKDARKLVQDNFLKGNPSTPIVEPGSVGELCEALLGECSSGFVNSDDSNYTPSRIRIFGEVSAVLLELGHLESAKQSESIWHSLTKKHGFSLFCCYSSVFGRAGDHVYEAICDRHSAMFPSESQVGIREQSKALASWKIQATQLLEQQITASQAQLHVQNLTSFVAYLCHELRNPLHGVIGSLSLFEQSFNNLQSLFNELLLEQQKHNKKKGEHKHQQVNELFEKLKGYFGDIDTCVSYQTMILNHNLDIARLAEGKLELESKPISIASHLKDIVRMFRSTASKKDLKVNLIVPEPPHEIFGRGDMSRITQVVTNLLTNSIKFTEQGSIEIVLKALDPLCDLKSVHSSATIEITVRDTGVGMSEQQYDRLFQRFETLHVGHQYAGSGLGLHISKKIAQLMGGDLLIESKLGAGTTAAFRFQLKDASCSCNKEITPVTSTNTFSSTTKTPPMPLQHSSSVANLDSKVSIIPLKNLSTSAPNATTTTTLSTATLTLSSTNQSSSSPSNSSTTSPTMAATTSPNNTSLSSTTPQTTKTLLNSSSAALAQTQAAPSPPPFHLSLSDPMSEPTVLRIPRNFDIPNCQFFCAVDGEQALQQMFAENYFDVIFMDIQMPNLDGIQATRLLRMFENTRAKTKPHIQPAKIIAITANSMEFQKNDAINSGMNDFLGKPFRKDQILSKVESWL